MRNRTLFASCLSAVKGSSSLLFGQVQTWCLSLLLEVRIVRVQVPSSEIQGSRLEMIITVQEYIQRGFDSADVDPPHIENELYDQVQPEQHPFIHKTQLIIKKVLGFTVPLFHARGVFNYDVGMMPYRRPINVVVGRPIKVQQASKPEEAYVDELHDVYVKELERIWEEWKDEFAMERTGELQIVE